MKNFYLLLLFFIISCGESNPTIKNIEGDFYGGSENNIEFDDTISQEKYDPYILVGKFKVKPYSYANESIRVVIPMGVWGKVRVILGKDTLDTEKEIKYNDESPIVYNTIYREDDIKTITLLGENLDTNWLKKRGYLIRGLDTAEIFLLKTKSEFWVFETRKKVTYKSQILKWVDLETKKSFNILLSKSGIIGIDKKFEDEKETFFDIKYISNLLEGRNINDLNVYLDTTLVKAEKNKKGFLSIKVKNDLLPIQNKRILIISKDDYLLPFRSNPSILNIFAEPALSEMSIKLGNHIYKAKIEDNDIVFNIPSTVKSIRNYEIDYTLIKSNQTAEFNKKLEEWGKDGEKITVLNEFGIKREYTARIKLYTPRAIGPKNIIESLDLSSNKGTYIGNINQRSREIVFFIPVEDNVDKMFLSSRVSKGSELVLGKENYKKWNDGERVVVKNKYGKKTYTLKLNTIGSNLISKITIENGNKKIYAEKELDTFFINLPMLKDIDDYRLKSNKPKGAKIVSEFLDKPISQWKEIQTLQSVSIDENIKNYIIVTKLYDNILYNCQFRLGKLNLYNEIDFKKNLITVQVPPNINMSNTEINFEYSMPEGAEIEGASRDTWEETNQIKVIGKTGAERNYQVVFKPMDTYKGDFFFTSESAMNTFSKYGFKNIDGNVTIKGDYIKELKSLRLEKIKVLVIKDNPNLKSIKGLKSLRKIKKLEITNNVLLISLQGLENLDSIKDIDISYNYSLVSLQGIKIPKNLQGDLKIRGNAMLRSLSELNGIETISGDLEISFSENLETLKGLETLEAIGGRFEVLYIDKLIDFEGLDNLEHVGKDFNVISNRSLESFNGVDSIIVVGDFLRIIKNSRLSDINGLKVIKSIKNKIVISENKSLESLIGIEEIETEQIQISDNIMLSDICPLKTNLKNGNTSVLMAKNGISKTKSEILNDNCSQPIAGGSKIRARKNKSLIPSKSSNYEDDLLENSYDEEEIMSDDYGSYYEEEESSTPVESSWDDYGSYYEEEESSTSLEEEIMSDDYESYYEEEESSTSLEEEIMSDDYESYYEEEESSTPVESSWDDYGSYYDDEELEEDSTSDELSDPEDDTSNDDTSNDDTSNDDTSNDEVESYTQNDNYGYIHKG